MLRLMSGITKPEPGLNHNQIMMMIGIPWQIVHPQIKRTYGYCTTSTIVFRTRNLPPLLGSHQAANLRSFSQHRRLHRQQSQLTLYPRVDEILDSCADRAARFAKESKPLYRVLPFKRKSTPIGDRPDFCVARYVNSDFSRIARQKTILKSRASSVSLSDLEKLDRASRSLIAGQSQSFWLLSSLLAQLRDEEFKPADPNLFDKRITTLSASLASQTNLSSGISEFVTSKQRESYLAHTSCPVGKSVKRELLVGPGTDNLLFNQPLLEKVVSMIKED